MTYFRGLLAVCAALALPGPVHAEPTLSPQAKARVTTAAPAKLSEAKRARFQASLDRKFPRGAHALEARLAARLTPEGREWVAKTAYGFATGQVTESQVEAGGAAGKGSYILSLGDAEGDIMALTFIVMMEAAKSAQEDLKSIMDGVKLINKQKEGLRKIQDTINKLAAATAGKDECDENGCVKVESATNLLDSQAMFGPAICKIEDCDVKVASPSRATIDAAADKARGDIDSMSELGEMESLRLQMAMDRMSKMMSTLSNLLKKTSDTSRSITQNLK